jgi:hypothetical protein
MSAKIALLPGEEVVMSLDNLTLTTKRVRYDSTVFRSSSFISVTLDSVASCGLETKSFPILLLLAALALIGAYTQRVYPPWVLLVAAAVLAIAYFLTRRAVISLPRTVDRRF